MKNNFSLWFVTAFLVAYTVIAYLEISLSLVFFMFALSPFLVVWMVISVLKAKPHSFETLKDGEEWGYLDVNKEDLKAF